MAYFTSWSFCLVVTSTVLGAAVSLKYLITCHHLSRVVVHGRPGLALHDNRSQHASDSVASTSTVTLDDVENGISPAFVQPALLASLSSRQSHRLGDTPWVMQAPVLSDSAAITRVGHAVDSQHAAAAGSFLPTESAFAKGSWHDPCDPAGVVPAELHYDWQVTAASLYMSFVALLFVGCRFVYERGATSYFALLAELTACPACLPVSKSVSYTLCFTCCVLAACSFVQTPPLHLSQRNSKLCIVC